MHHRTLELWPEWRWWQEPWVSLVFLCLISFSTTACCHIHYQCTVGFWLWQTMSYSWIPQSSALLLHTNPKHSATSLMAIACRSIWRQSEQSNVNSFSLSHLPSNLGRYLLPGFGWGRPPRFSEAGSASPSDFTSTFMLGTPAEKPEL